MYKKKGKKGNLKKKEVLPEGEREKTVDFCPSCENNRQFLKEKERRLHADTPAAKKGAVAGKKNPGENRSEALRTEGEGGEFRSCFAETMSAAEGKEGGSADPDVRVVCRRKKGSTKRKKKKGTSLSRKKKGNSF